MTKYQRDLLGQVEKVTDALGFEERYGYDAKGQLLEKLDQEGYLTRYGYSPQGDIHQIQYADGREVKLSYNPLRQLQEMEDWLGITKIENDPIGRAQRVQYPDGKAVSYTYGQAGERTSLTYPDGRTVHYGYDVNLRLSELKDGDSVINYGYDEAGRLSKKAFPNGMYTNYQYDSKGQIQELRHMDTKGILDQYRYQYDLLGNKTGIEKQRRGLEAESGSYQYGYDPLGRLNDVVKDGTPLRTYGYDAFGNRTSLMEVNQTTTYHYNSVNQLLSKMDADVEETYTYDKRGNLSPIIANGQIKNQYVYGALNRLEEARNCKGEVARYLYNGLGYRVGKRVQIGKPSEGNNQTMRQDAIAANLDPVKQLQAENFAPTSKIDYTIDLTKQYHNLLQKEEQNHNQTYLWDGNVAGMLDGADFANPQYYLQDDLGSPIRLADGAQNLKETYGYDEFGQDLYQNQGATQPFGYTGYQLDDVTGTYFAQVREYQPREGRFVGEDIIKGTIVAPRTINPYNYCWNRPMNYVDLNGAWPKWIEEAGTALDNAINWTGDRVSDAAHVIYDNSIGKIVGTDQVIYEREYGGGSYEVTSHIGGDIIVIKKDQKGKFDGWSINADISFGDIISNKQSISGKDWNPESWKYTNNVEVNASGGVSFAGGLYMDKEGIGIQGSSSGSTGTMPLALPDGTQIDEFGDVSWSYTIERNFADWGQVLETVGVTAAIVALVWLVANDATIIGVLDDALVVPLCTYLATKAPAIFQLFSQMSPQIIKAMNDLRPCID